MEEAPPTPCTASSSESDGPFVSHRVWEGGEGDFLPQAGKECEETGLYILCEWKMPPSDLIFFSFFFFFSYPLPTSYCKGMTEQLSPVGSDSFVYHLSPPSL